LSEDNVHKKQIAGNNTSARMKRRYGDVTNDYKKRERERERISGASG
jgi:hypothetical protein